MARPRKTTPKIGAAKPNRLRAIREQMGTTIEDMAGRVGVAPYTVSRWETLAVNIPAKRLDDVARAYQCAVSEIYELGSRPVASTAQDRIILAPVRLPSEEALAEILEALLDGNAMSLPMTELARMLADRLPEEIERALGAQHYRATAPQPDAPQPRPPSPRKLQ